MATYDYDLVGFPSSAADGDLLNVGNSQYIFSNNRWNAHKGAAGPQGDTGDIGATGIAGADSTVPGPSTYDVAVANGFVGTEAEWIKQFGSKGGQEFTGGFTDRLSGQTGASDFGTNVSYTQEEVDAGSWRRFGIDVTARDANDSPYWAGAAPTLGKGLFGGTQMPAGVTEMFDYTDTSLSAAKTTGGLQYSEANGSLVWTECLVGDQAMVRFGFNVIPQVANTTVEVGLIFATRDANDVVTYTFPLTTTPLFYGSGSVGKTFLNRPTMTAYFASQEDINARALPAIRADNPVFIQPLSMLTTIIR